MYVLPNLCNPTSTGETHAEESGRSGSCDQWARRRAGARSGSGTGGSCAAPRQRRHRPGTLRPAKPAGGGQKVGQTGNPDPGVNFLNVVENPHVRVLQVTLQPGAVRRPHVHNDVTFHMLVPITGSLELTVEKDPVVTTVPGQAYYMVKGQTHSFTNKTAAAVQVIELFIKPDPGAVAPAAAAPLPRRAGCSAGAGAGDAAGEVTKTENRKTNRAKKKGAAIAAAPFPLYSFFVLRSSFLVARIARLPSPSSDSSPPSRALPATPPT